MQQFEPVTAAIEDLVSEGAIRYGDAITFSGLTLVPVFTSRPSPFPYVLLADAIAAGTAVIQEVGGGHVPALRVVNKGSLPVLLVDGEHLVGVKQNRILNTTILVPERSALDVPVSCVEAGRWSGSLREARPESPTLFAAARARKAEAVTASVRATGAYAADQHEIWSDVAVVLDALDAHSPTAAMHEAYERRGAELGHFLKHLQSRPAQTGVVAAVGGRIVCADVFDRPQTLAGLWDRLVPSYAVEALARPGAAGGVSAADAAAFLGEARRATVTAHPAVGRGTDLRLSGDGLTGAALEVEGTVVHLAMFRVDVRRSDGPSGARFASVAQRRRGGLVI